MFLDTLKNFMKEDDQKRELTKMARKYVNLKPLIKCSAYKMCTLKKLHICLWFVLLMHVLTLSATKSQHTLRYVGS